MRRQFGVGGVQPVGSSRDMRLDPQSLPISFQARDGRADGEMRHIQIDRERVVVRRAVRGMNMTVQIRIREFLGIARRASAPPAARATVPATLSCQPRSSTVRGATSVRASSGRT